MTKVAEHAAATVVQVPDKLVLRIDVFARGYPTGDQVDRQNDILG
jgi:hypothetical protein